MSNYLLQGNSLYLGCQLVSTNDAYFLSVQPDGNLALYVSNHFVPDNIIWSSKTSGKGSAPYRLTVQADCNVVLFDKANTAIWSSNTNFAGKYVNLRLQLANDGTLYLLDGSTNTIWSSNSTRN